MFSITEHHSDLLPWRLVCREKKAVLKFIDCEQDGTIDLGKVESLITDKTKIVAIAQVSNILGRVNPIKEIAALAAQKRSCHSSRRRTKHSPHSRKRAGYGCGFLRVLRSQAVRTHGNRRALRKERASRAICGRSLSGGEMIETVSRTSAVYAELPDKFGGRHGKRGRCGRSRSSNKVRRVRQGFDAIHKLEA